MNDIRPAFEDGRGLAQTIVNTAREPLLVLDKDLRVVAASRSFYVTFQADRQEMQGDFYPIGLYVAAIQRTRGHCHDGRSIEILRRVCLACCPWRDVHSAQHNLHADDTYVG
jgi:hypothetical protein